MPFLSDTKIRRLYPTRHYVRQVSSVDTKPMEHLLSVDLLASQLSR